MLDRTLLKDDLYKAVNGSWEENAVIPDDKVSTGGFNDLADEVEEIMMADTKKMINGEIELTDENQEKFVKYYKLVLDFDKRNELGAAPVKPYIEKIQALASIKDFQNLAIEWLIKGLALPFSANTYSDLSNADLHAMYLIAASTFLPDKTYYVEGNESGKKLLAAFKETLEKTLLLFDFSETEAKDLVDLACKFDARIVPIVRSSEENADVSNMNNPRTIDEVEAYLDNFSFKELLTTLVGETPNKVIVEQPKYFENLQELLQDETLAELKAWMICNLCYQSRDLLSEEIRQTAGQYELILQGKPELLNSEKAAYYLAKSKFNQVVGNYYGEKYFGPEAREDVRSMVKTMVKVYKDRLHNNTWISKETAEKAIEKLDALGIFVGYPDYYPKEYASMQVNENLDLFENSLNLDAVVNKLNFEHWNKETDRTRWGMPADMVNAYFSPLNNLICFPAAILQAPFYSLEQSQSKNYGGIGAVMAHEISHGFDNNGSKFDAKGNMNNWWKDEDFEVFDNKAKDVIAQFDGLPFAGLEVNGKLTVSENIADLGGLTCALESLKLQEEYDLEEFFCNWARCWRQKARTEFSQLLMNVDVHAPAYWRANQIPQNLNEFHETFATKEGNKMYLAPEKRIEIW